MKMNTREKRDDEEREGKKHTAKNVTIAYATDKICNVHKVMYKITVVHVN